MKSVIAFFAIGIVSGYVIGHWIIPVTVTVSAEDTAESSLHQNMSKFTRNEIKNPRTLSSNDESRSIQEIQEKIDRLKNEEKFQQMLLEGYKAERQGMSLPWPESVAPQYTQSGFIASLRKTIEENNIKGAIAKVDCGECPCIGAIRLTDASSDASKMFSSQTWVQSYGAIPKGFEFLLSLQNEVSCKTGSKENVLFVQSLWNCESESHSMRHYSSDLADRMMKGNISDKDLNLLKRQRSRIEEIITRWDCE